MQKKKIRTYKAFAHVAPNIYNYEVYYLVYEGWSNFSLATCINCGELFVIDWENPKTKGLNIEQIADSHKCPTCNSNLTETIRDYPKMIKLKNGEIGSFVPSNQIPPDNESFVKEFYEIL